MKRTLSFLMLLLCMIGLSTVIPVSGAPIDLADVKATATPQITRVAGDNNGAIISWSKVAGAAKYRLFIKSGGSWKKLADTSATSYTYKKAKVNTFYTYTVRCISSNGKAYTSSYNKQGYTARILPDPLITSAENTNSGVLLKWKPVAGAAWYRVFYKTNGAWQRLTDTKESSAIDSTASNAMITTYTVRCLSADKKYYTGGFNPIGITNRYYTTPHVEIESCGVMVNEEKYGQNPYLEIAVTWSTSTPIYDWDYFRVLYKTKSENKWHTLITTGAKRTVFHGDPGEEYRFTVRNISPNGKTYLSDYIPTGWCSANIPAPSYTDSVGYMTAWKINNGEYTPYEDKNNLTFSWYEPSGLPYLTYRIFIRENGAWKKLADQKSVTMFIYNISSLKDRYQDFQFAVRVLSNDKKEYISDYRVLHVINSPDGVSSYTE